MCCNILLEVSFGITFGVYGYENISGQIRGRTMAQKSLATRKVNYSNLQKN